MRDGRENHPERIARQGKMTIGSGNKLPGKLAP
jgi:hypothetical protein